MSKLKIKKDPRVAPVFQQYPEDIRPKLNALRSLILASAEELEIQEIEETLKWGEPSYLTKKGSTIRIDWKAKTPNQYAMYFKCTSKLVTTFREVYGTTFQYEKNRALIFAKNDELPIEELKGCIKLALRYHEVKKLPRLGV